jgi:hypothetical protein
MSGGLSDRRAQIMRVMGGGGRLYIMLRKGQTFFPALLRKGEAVRFA